MPISFVWLYVFKCDVCVLNHMWIKLKRFLIVLFVFGSVFHHSLFLGFVPSLFFNVSSFFFFFSGWKIGIKVFCKLFTTLLWVAKLKNAFLAFLVIRQRLLWVSHEKGSLAKHLRKFPATCENFQVSYFMGISWVFSSKLLICLYYDSILFKPSFSKLLHQNPTNFKCFTFH